MNRIKTLARLFNNGTGSYCSCRYCVRLRQMLGHGTKFGRKKEEAIAALRNIEEAARAIGVVPNTILRWMKLPEFQAACREARRAAYGQSIARMQ
jgi:hypothetical protein